MAYLLVVDDDEDFGTAAATVLRRAGYEVAVELNTAAALRSIRRRTPDLVLLDVMFPEDAEGGFRLAAAIRRGRAVPGDVPILMLTAVSAHMPVGFGCRDVLSDRPPDADFVEKPVDMEHLLIRVSRALANAPTAH